MAALQLAFDVLARDKASKVLDDIGGKADTLGSKLGGVGGAAKTALAGGAAAGVGLLGAAMVQGVKDAVSYETLQKKTAAVIESTGNAAGISVKGVQELAGELESMSGVDEEEIINSQNVLATFKRISNNGPGDTFDEAAKAALNMSVAMGTDLKGASLQVGKALNDPIKGLSALGRAGVQFTAAQKEQVKAMMEAGDVAGAQKVILGELETQFGGAAEAAGSGFAGSLARLQDALGDSFREIGEALLPVLTDLAEWLAENLPGAIERARSFFKDASVVIKEDVLPVLNDIWTVIRDDVIPVLQDMADFFVNTVIPKMQEVATFITDDVVPVITTIATTIAEVVTTVGEKVDAIVTFFAGLPGRIGEAAGDVWGFLRDSFVGVLNFIIRAWNGLDFKLPSFDGLTIAGQTVIPGWEGPTLGLPTIPLIGTGASGPNRGGLRTMHMGGTVTPWGVEPLRSDEVMAKLQVGETVLPRGSGLGATHNWYINEAQHYGPDDLLRAAAARLA